MRVITGIARGRKLVTLEGEEVVRPTTCLLYTSSLLSLKYVNRDFMSGLIDIDGTLFNFDSSHHPIRGHKAISDVQYYFNDNGALSSMVGIDVSHHNGKICLLYTSRCV